MRLHAVLGSAIAALLAFVAASGLTWYLVTSQQSSTEGAFKAAAERLTTARSQRTANAVRGPLLGEPIALLQIPRLGVAGVVVEGDSNIVLDRGIGHLPDTPLPWQSGNSAIAAHRTTLFRPLRNIRAGDALILTTLRGDLEYRVSRTTIVDPRDLSVLAPTPHATLTLITCYPFDYVGAAPQRFVVHAEQTGRDALLRDDMTSG